jgi:hypothetical protein
MHQTLAVTCSCIDIGTFEEEMRHCTSQAKTLSAAAAAVASASEAAAPHAASECAARLPLDVIASATVFPTSRAAPLASLASFGAALFQRADINIVVSVES